MHRWKEQGSGGDRLHGNRGVNGNRSGGVEGSCVEVLFSVSVCILYWPV